MAFQVIVAGAGVNAIDMDPTQLPDNVLRDISTPRLNWLFRRYFTPPILRMDTKQKRRRLKNRVNSRNYRARKRQQLRALMLSAAQHQQRMRMMQQVNNNQGQVNNNQGQGNNNQGQVNNNRGQVNYHLRQVNNNRGQARPNPPQANRNGFLGWFNFF